MSVNYCVGDINSKRRAFRSIRDDETVMLDNEEVVVTFALSNKLYCVIGELPYANMSVAQYISYSKALLNRRPLNDVEVKRALKEVKCHLPIHSLIGDLNRIQFRYVMLAARLGLNTKRIFINFDGLEYSSLIKYKLSKLVKRIGKNYEVFVSVSDYRLLPVRARLLSYSKSGEIIEVTKAARQKSTQPSRRSVYRLLKKRGLCLKLGSIKKVVTCPIY